MATEACFLASWHDSSIGLFVFDPPRQILACVKPQAWMHLHQAIEANT